MSDDHGDTAASQAKLLLDEIVRPNVGTAYGEAHAFGSIETVDDYRRAVPLAGYEDLRPWIDRMAKGETGVLTAAKPIAFFKTSGSTSRPKLIPVTRVFAAQKARAFGDYWAQVYADHPTIETGRMIANFGDHTQAEKSEGGVRILSETSFWNERMQIARGRGKWPTPPGLRRIEDAEIRYFAAARFALQGPLHGIMCLNPSTLLAFCRTIERHREALADGLSSGRLGLASAEGDPAVEALLDGLERAPVPPALAGDQPVRLGELWPDLDLVICWRSEAVRPYTRLIEPYLRGVAVRDYLTQSSECIMAIPFEDDVSGGRLAAGSHFYEFIEDSDIEHDRPATLLAGALEVGGIYELVASTANGFYRYRTGDRLLVKGYRDGAPVLDFMGRAGVGSSMTGEKLSEPQVRAAIEAASHRMDMTPAQVLCFPRSGSEPHYGLMLSGFGEDGAAAACRWIDAFEQALQTANCEYSDKRASGRLGPPRGFLANLDAFELHRQQIADERKVSLDQVKVGLLTSSLDLDQRLPARPAADADR